MAIHAIPVVNTDKSQVTAAALGRPDKLLWEINDPGNPHHGRRGHEEVLRQLVGALNIDTSKGSNVDTKEIVDLTAQ